MVSRLSRISVREVVVDFFGSLVPGFIFTIAVLAVLGLPVASLLVVLSHLPSVQTVTLTQVGNAAVGFMSAMWFEVAVFTLMVSFVSGHLFYRMDPKRPDKRSFARIARGLEPAELATWVVAKVDACEFPYPNLRGYLEARGLDHLAHMVPFTASGHSMGVRRTKNFINILKVRLAFHHGDKCAAIARNEAHVRLMSSTWYMCRSLAWISLGAFVLTACVDGAALYLFARRGMKLNVTAGVLPLMLTAAVGLTAFVTRKRVEHFLHYQRVREVVFVLETSYVAFRDRYELIRDVCPDVGSSVHSRQGRLHLVDERLAG